MTTTTEHEWLRRLSDYHSGGVSAAEAEAVEGHLAGCEECRQALGVYRRFYVLASSPLQLGEPSSVVAEQLSVNHDSSGGFRVGDRLGHYPQPRDRMRLERNRLLLGIASVLAASLVIVGFLAVLGPRIHVREGQATLTPLASATSSGPTPTVQTTNLLAPGTGYTNAGPDWATNLAFAPSSPNIVYACGELPADSGPLLIDVSTDGGRTWHPRTSPGKLSACALTVDSTNPRDLALVSYYCSGPVSTPSNPVCEPHTHLYRSYDGGQSWSEVNTPGGDWIDVQIAWLGGTLFIGTTEGIARSISGGPMTLLRQSFFGSTTVETEGRRLFTSGNALIVQALTCPATEVSIVVCNGPTARSDDLGAHWSLIPMTYRSNTVMLAASGTDGKTLFGTSPTATYLRSINSGATWNPLPPLPASSYGFTGEFETSQGLLSGMPITEAPDGSIYTMFNFTGPISGTGSPSRGIYVLAPGAENWRYLAPPPGGNPQIFLWNSSGHLAVIWGGRGSPSLSGFQYRLF
jgi:hypothetical protein